LKIENMKYTSKFNESEKQELIEKISDVLNETGAYKRLHFLLVDDAEVILHSDMENLAPEIEEFIYKWTIIQD
tara:strand:- start:65 stop:283 length:219 start_codon:yes stop_codon:yes gene_type:complete